MYIFRNRNGNYYTRISLPKTLRDNGFPFSVCASLDTKCRDIAKEKNLSIALFIKRSICNIPSDVHANSFSIWIKSQLDRFKAIGCEDKMSASNSASLIPDIVSQSIVQSGANSKHLLEAFDAFIESKQTESISERSVAQLRLRVGHFINWLKTKASESFSRKDAMAYRNDLLGENRSYKTNKDYLSATRQFFQFCLLTDRCSENYFQGIKLGKEPAKRPDESRKRWSTDELSTIFSWLNEKHDFLNSSHLNHAYHFVFCGSRKHSHSQAMIA